MPRDTHYCSHQCFDIVQHEATIVNLQCLEKTWNKSKQHVGQKRNQENQQEELKYLKDKTIVLKNKKAFPSYQK